MLNNINSKGELVSFVRKVLEIVPRSMFQILAQIIDILTNKMRELPTKVEKERLAEFSQLDVRYLLAQVKLNFIFIMIIVIVDIYLLNLVYTCNFRIY